MRTTLASTPPSTAAAFTAAARKRLAQTLVQHPLPAPATLFTPVDGSDEVQPFGEFAEVLRRARALYGAGMGFASLGVLTHVVRATLGLRWDVDGATADALAAVDADIAQGLQSSREELGAGRVDVDHARGVVAELEQALDASQDETAQWGGDFPFERALVDVQHWKL